MISLMRILPCTGMGSLNSFPLLVMVRPKSLDGLFLLDISTITNFNFKWDIMGLIGESFIKLKTLVLMVGITLMSAFNSPLPKDLSLSIRKTGFHLSNTMKTS